MKFSSLIQRIVMHNLAIQRVENGEAVTVLSIGQETDETTPDLVVESAVDSLRAGRHHYSDVRGDEPLRAAVANYHTRLTTQSVTADNVTIYNGAQRNPKTKSFL